MRDRLPTPGKENRVKITMDNGSVVEGVLSYADDATQEGSAYTKGNVLPDGVCKTLGIDKETSEPADAFATLSPIPNGNGVLLVRVNDADGNPLGNCTVVTGEIFAITNGDGVAALSLPAGTYTLIVTSPIDHGAEESSHEITISSGEYARIFVQKENRLSSKELRIASTKIAMFSDKVAEADAFLVGGGGSGVCQSIIRSSSPGSSYYSIATGASSGYTDTFLDIAVSVYKLSVGAGGESTSTANGHSGGKTEIVDMVTNETLCLVNGGSSAKSTTTSGTAGADGGSGSAAAGNGVGKSGEDGSDGASSTIFSSSTTLSGGKGQGKTTRLWGEPDGELFSGAGAGAYVGNGGKNSIGTPGAGGGTALTVYGVYDIAEEHKAGDGQTPGSGGGSIVVYAVGTTTTVAQQYSGAGADGLIVLRWRDAS